MWVQQLQLHACLITIATSAGHTVARLCLLLSNFQPDADGSVPSEKSVYRPQTQRLQVTSPKGHWFERSRVRMVTNSLFPNPNPNSQPKPQKLVSTGYYYFFVTVTLTDHAIITLMRPFGLVNCPQLHIHILRKPTFNVYSRPGPSSSRPRPRGSRPRPKILALRTSIGGGTIEALGRVPPHFLSHDYATN